MYNYYMLEKDERMDDLQLKGLKIIQNRNQFCFGTDAVLVSHFSNAKKHSSIIDLGTGNGIIPLLLYGKFEVERIAGIEIQEEAFLLAKRNVQLNNLEDRISLVNGDIKDIHKYFPIGSFDHVISNPPYIKKGTGIINAKDNLAYARHEILCDLEDILKATRYLLNFKGSFTMVHRPDRLNDILYLMKKHYIEPKRIRFVHSNEKSGANLVLIQGLKDMNPFLTVEKPLIIHRADGSYTDEIFEIYGRER